MALDPRISLGVQPMQLPDPLAQYGKVAAIQNAQNQNALAQYQLGAAQRAEAKDIARTNALAQAGTDDTAIANALLRVGDLKGYADFVKTRRETMKADTELVDAKLKQSRSFLDTIDPNDPNAPQQYLAWHQANHADPVLGPVLKARGITAEQSLGRINDAIAKGPQAFAQLIAQSKLGTEKFMELNKPQLSTKDTGSQLIDRTFSPLTGEIRTISTEKKTMSPYESARIGQENQRLAQEATGVVYQEDANGNIVALPSKLKKGEVPTARIAVAPGGGFQPLAAKPSEAVGKEQMSLNQQKAIVQGAIDAAKATPDAFGWTTGNMPESVRARMASSAENEARAFVFNVVSGVIKERAGTAQSAGEAATLRRFLPDETDNAQIIQDKMEGFQKYLAAKEAGTTKKRAAPEKPTPVRINGDDDYNKLPSGALFIGPDGQQRRKP